jgi:hypothetical protein
MKALLLLFFGITFLGLAYSSDEDRMPCDMPNMWMGSFHSLKVDDKYCFSKVSFGHMRYDFNNKKLRVDYMKKILNKKTLSKDDSLIKGSLFYCFDKGMGYHYKRDNETCSSFKIGTDMIPPSIPENSNFMGLSMIGGQTIETWQLSGNDTSKQKSWGEFIAFTEDSCLPVSVMTYDPETEKVKYSLQLWDVVPSVPPFSFELPDICKKAEPAPFVLKKEQMGPLGPQMNYEA